MEKTKVKNVMQGAMILTIAGLVGKVLSAIYRIPLQNLTGDMGFYIYQQVYPLIGIGMILSLYGYPAAISKLVAERKYQGLPNNKAEVYIPITAILFGLNVIIAGTLYYMAPHLAHWIGDSHLTGAYRTSAGLFIVLPFLAVLRGVYQGNEQVLPTAVSQVVEQLVRVSVIIGSAYLIFIGRLDLYAIGHAGVFASIIGMTVAIVGWSFFLRNAKKAIKQGKRNPIPWVYYIKTCLSLGIIAAMGHLILLLMQLVDVLTIVPGLLESGVTQRTAMEMKGIFDRGQPLIQFGAVIGSSFALALVPSAVRDAKIRAMATSEAVQFSFYFAGAASLGLILLMPEVNQLLFLSTDGTVSLRILMVSIMLTALLITAASILQSMGYVNIVAGCIFIAFGLKWLLNWLLVPHFHLTGSALGTAVSLFVLTLLLFRLLHRKVIGTHFLGTIRLIPFLSAAGTMSAFIFILKYSFSTMEFSRAVLFVFVLGAVCIGALIYVVILLGFRVFSNKQLQALPFSHHLLSVYEWFDHRKRG